MKVAACAKHFAVHSGPEAIRHEFDAEVSQKDLYETYLPAFEAAVKRPVWKPLWEAITEPMENLAVEVRHC